VDFLVLIPARNEAATIGHIVRAVKKHLACEVVVIDDASTDETAEIARSAGATVLPLSCNLGAWGGTQAGIRYALKAGYRHVLTMDADGQHLPESLSSLLAALTLGEVDVVIGACTERGSRARQFVWTYFRKLTGLGIEDLTSGFRAYNYAAMTVLASPEATLLDYQDVGVLLLLRHARLQIKEISVPMRKRDHGGSRVFSSWFIVGKYMLQTSILCLAKVGMNGKQ
jgi:glycosyltransferase involved in cell wall biosynthesis